MKAIEAYLDLWTEHYEIPRSMARAALETQQTDWFDMELTADTLPAFRRGVLAELLSDEVKAQMAEMGVKPREQKKRGILPWRGSFRNRIVKK